MAFPVIRGIVAFFLKPGDLHDVAVDDWKPLTCNSNVPRSGLKTTKSAGSSRQTARTLGDRDRAGIHRHTPTTRRVFRAALHSALLSDAELALGPDAWSNPFVDEFPRWEIEAAPMTVPVLA